MGLGTGDALIPCLRQGPAVVWCFVAHGTPTHRLPQLLILTDCCVLSIPSNEEVYCPVALPVTQFGTLECPCTDERRPKRRGMDVLPLTYLVYIHCACLQPGPLKILQSRAQGGPLLVALSVSAHRVCILYVFGMSIRNALSCG